MDGKLVVEKVVMKVGKKDEKMDDELAELKVSLLVLILVDWKVVKSVENWAVMLVTMKVWQKEQSWESRWVVE